MSLTFFKTNLTLWLRHTLKLKKTSSDYCQGRDLGPHLETMLLPHQQIQTSLKEGPKMQGPDKRFNHKPPPVGELLVPSPSFMPFFLIVLRQMFLPCLLNVDWLNPPPLEQTDTTQTLTRMFPWKLSWRLSPCNGSIRSQHICRKTFHTLCKGSSGCKRLLSLSYLKPQRVLSLILCFYLIFDVRFFSFNFFHFT